MKTPDLGAIIESFKEQLGQFREPDTTALMLLTPNMKGTPDMLRPLLQPIVAAASVVGLLIAMCAGASAFGILMLASAIAYLIVTKIFGLELNLNMPTNWNG